MDNLSIKDKLLYFSYIIHEILKVQLYTTNLIATLHHIQVLKQQMILSTKINNTTKLCRKHGNVSAFVTGHPAKLHPLTSQCPEADTQTHERVEGDLALVGVATDDDPQRLRAEVVAKSGQCLLQLSWLHRTGSVSIVLHEGRLRQESKLQGSKRIE